MTSNQMLILLIISCLIIAVIAMFPDFFSLVGRLIINCAGGIGSIYGINYVLVNILNFETFNVGINVVSAITVSILGVPGVAGLYIVQYVVG